jgi:uncharacterized protein DUF1592/uncharacterized protein DUF1588/uncharacterized protein DUF1595/uncharacterized protein DUF1585/uncharacterized protein DUF1587
MKHGMWVLVAVLVAPACTGRITGSGGTSSATPVGQGGAGAGGTTIAPPGMTPVPIDPTDTGAAETCMPSIAPAPLRRLSYAEYQATTTDLLGPLKTADITLSRDPDERGFENRASLLNPSPMLVEQWGDGAIGAGLAVSAAMAGTSGVVPCTPKTAADEAACGVQFIQQFGAKAFRRPLTAEEVADYTAFFEGERANSSFAGAVQLTTETFLQAPQFLYRMELGDPATAATDRIKLTSYEIASRLSYLVWGSAPDATLLTAAAAANGLDDAGARETHARRLLKDAHAGQMMVEFHRQWLDLDHLSKEPKDPKTYPSYDMTLESAIRDESDRFVRDVMWQGPGTIAAFLTSTSTEVNAPLAALYGVAAPAATATSWVAATLDPTQRAGFLTRANYLAGRAHQLEGSPPLRSVFIRDRLLCLPALMPPADANLSEPAATPGAMAQTNRQLFEARISPPTCKGCHTIINPMGYGLENYDAVGAYRTTDNGLPVDASGSINGSDVDGPFTGGVELSKKLAGSKTVAACATTNWYSYAVGRDLGTADACRLAKLNLSLSDAGGDVRELLVAIVTSPEFIYRDPVTP